ncbi:MAG TPA: DUF2934 domain-containing protein [Patescibacteria group bacterium]|nr:DUF2934 domain-containing protein [Patescibacteria group bacterium]
MASPRLIRFAPRAQEIKICQVVGNELNDKIHEAVAWRAFQFYEQEGCAPGHELGHWERAESEVVRPLDCGVLSQDHRVCLTTDAAIFDDGAVELFVEPWRLTICGFDRSRRPVPTPPGEPAQKRRDFIFRVHDFNVEIDPTGVAARFNGPVLNIYLPKAYARRDYPETAWVL